MKNIPVLTVQGRSLAEAYERALVALYRGGVPMATQYDRPGDPPSLDATLNLTVLEPWAEPMIHSCGIPWGGLWPSRMSPTRRSHP